MTATNVITVTVSDIQRELESLVDRVHQGEIRVVVEKDGTPVAVFVSPRDLERLDQFDAEWEDDFAVFDEISSAFADVPLEELEQEVDKAVAEVRAEMRAEREAGIAR
jgi:prevent-host-death family protein